MQTKIMSIFTRTPLHVGCGSSVGAVDQPVVRERHTGYPVIPGSSIKGVLADLWTVKDGEGNYVRESTEGIALFGNDASDKNAVAKAGSLLVGEGKLLAFPVRSAKNCFVWVTCPFVLDRFARDTGSKFARIEDGKVLSSKELVVSDSVILEEYPLNVDGTVPSDLIAVMKEACPDGVWVDNLERHLAVISDDLFAYFAKNACEIANHNRIDDKSGIVADGALFSQENVPSETLFYAMFSSAKDDDFAKIETKLVATDHKLQIGADMTTGLGWCSVGLGK